MDMRNTPVKTASKDILARCLATEDITVQHKQIPTAYFDVKNRVLALPMWKDMSDHLYDMLVGHEVGHALETPAIGWEEGVGSIDSRNPGVAMQFLNIVEDARIERKMKEKFPGLRRDFAQGYRELSHRDLFEIAGKNVNDSIFIDRINLHFKLGILGIEDVKFNAEEQAFVDEIATTDTFEDVLDVSRRLYDYCAKNEPNMNPQQSTDANSGSGESDASAPSNETGDHTDNDGTSSAYSESTDSTSDNAETENGEGASSGGDEGEHEGEGDGKSEGDSNGTDSGQSADDDTDDGESADSQDGDSGSNGMEGGTEGSGGVPQRSQTQDSLENGLEELRDEQKSTPFYGELPELNLDNIVVDWKVIHDEINEATAQHRASIIADYRRFESSVQKTVNQLAQQFRMKQAADAHKRVSISKTGVLDTNKMVDYRWSEDIFRKISTVTDGKNHGLVMFIDWSGSMSGTMQDTVNQLLILTLFCKKVNIPFEVYSFTSETRHPADVVDTREYLFGEMSKEKNWFCPNTFALNNYLSSRMNAREFKDAVANMRMLGECCDSYYGIEGYSTRNTRHELGGTPLNEAIIAGTELVQQFQERTGVQIVNTVFLTDGAGHSINHVANVCDDATGWYSRNAICTEKNGKSYEVRDTAGWLRRLRDITGSKTVGFFINGGSVRYVLQPRHGFDYDNVCENQKEYNKQWKTENYLSPDNALEHTGYDEYFILKANTKVVSDPLEDLDEDASFTKLRNAFSKGSQRKTASKTMLNRFTDLIAK